MFHLFSHNFKLGTHTRFFLVVNRKCVYVYMFVTNTYNQPSTATQWHIHLFMERINTLTCWFVLLLLLLFFALLDPSPWWWGGCRAGGPHPHSPWRAVIITSASFIKSSAVSSSRRDPNMRVSVSCLLCGF